MKKEINLTLGRKADNKLVRRLLMGSSIAFSIVVIITIGILAFRLFLSTQLANATSDEEVLIAQLDAVREQRDKLVITKERLVDAQKIISRRQDITSKFGMVENIVPSQASLETFSGTEEEVEVRIESESLEALSELINERIATLANEQKGVQKIEMKSFILNPLTKIYTVVFAVTYK